MGKKKGPAHPQTMRSVQNRIVGLKYVKPGDLDEHPHNWRQHPNSQRAALEELLHTVGMADALLAYKSARSGRFTIIDGHLRKNVLAAENKVPVLVLDLTDDEANTVLLAHDPIGAMATAQEEMYATLIEELGEQEKFGDLARMLDTDRADPGQVQSGGVFTPEEPALYDIVPLFDEAYDGVLIFCTNAREWAELATMLDLPKKVDRNGKVGTTHVVTMREFKRAWQSKS